MKTLLFLALLTFCPSATLAGQPMEQRPQIIIEDGGDNQFSWGEVIAAGLGAAATITAAYIGVRYSRKS